jgi:hypothetical protein
MVDDVTGLKNVHSISAETGEVKIEYTGVEEMEEFHALVRVQAFTSTLLVVTAVQCRAGNGHKMKDHLQVVGKST